MDDPFLRVLASACLFAGSGFASGATLGLFRISRLRLEIEMARSDRPAQQARARWLSGLRKDSNYLLAALLVLNVAVNEAQPLVHPHGDAEGSVWWARVVAWAISFFGVLIFGEALPLAFSNKRRVDTRPVLYAVQVVKILTWPFAFPLARLLDLLVGPEAMAVLEERDLIEAIRIHMRVKSEIGEAEGKVAINALLIDELYPSEIGSPVHPSSVIALPIAGEFNEDDHYELGKPAWPKPGSSEWENFVRRVRNAKKDGVRLKWVIITDEDERVNCLLHRQDFLEAVHEAGAVDPGAYCHLPLIVRESKQTMGQLLPQFRQSMRLEDYDNVILYWNGARVILTGTDIQQELLKGVATRVDE